MFFMAGFAGFAAAFGFYCFNHPADYSGCEEVKACQKAMFAKQAKNGYHPCWTK